MQRAMELALLGAGYVSPNPMVGCVIVNNGQIVGEGYHQKYGEPHAEVNAVNSVQDLRLLEGATVYVTLEPCSHHGKTPPCADYLVNFPIKKVVICNQDPNPLVAGKGIAKLRQAGIEVETGVLEEKGKAVNRRFFNWITNKRPYIILKWAETSDGFIARENYDSKWISNKLSRTFVHKWRTEEDAVLVGTNTVKYDNPKLNVRDWTGRNPLRVFIDKNLEITSDFYIWDKTQDTICYNRVKQEMQGMSGFVKLNDNLKIASFIVQDLFEKNVQSIIVEGGSMLLNEFIQMNLWDEIRVFRTRKVFDRGIPAPVFRGELISNHTLLDDELYVYYPVL